MARLLAYDINGNVCQFEADAIPSNGNPFVVDTGGAVGKATVGASGTATLNKASGVITTEALSTAAASDFTETLTNSVIKATDLVFVTIQNGTNTGGDPVLGTVTPANGSLVIKVRNDGSSAFNGTLKIGFLRFATQ